MPNEEKKTDYLELAKTVYGSAKGYISETDQARTKAAQALASIAIAEELRRLNENFEKVIHNEQINIFYDCN